MKLKQEIIHIFTDGACSGNPGPMGVGYVYVYINSFGAELTKEVSKGIGHGTNNIAELSAIRDALSGVKSKSVPTILYTDSFYSIGVLVGGHTAQKNKELIAGIKLIIASFKNLTIKHIKGHSGFKYNEIADKLATKGVEENSLSVEAVLRRGYF